MSLGTTDGTPGKTANAKLMHELEKGVEHLAQVPVGSVLIVDRMAFIHQIHTVTSTFGPGILGNVLLVVSHGDICHSIVVNDAVVAVTEVLDLFSDHKEADTRLLLHTYQTARVFSSVSIKSPDTDAVVISLAKSHDFHGCLLLFMTGSGSNNRIINITELGIKLGQETFQAIIGLHIFYRM